MKYFNVLIVLILFLFVGCAPFQMTDSTQQGITREELQRLAEGTGAIKVRAFTVLDGEGTGALDAIDGADLNDLDIAIVVTSSGAYFYTLDDDYGDVAQGLPNTVKPSGTYGTKMWVLTTIYGVAVSTSAQDDAALDFDPDTASETHYYVGPNHDSVGDDNDNFEIRRSATPGTNVDFRVRRDVAAHLIDKVTQDYKELQLIIFDFTEDTAVAATGAFWFHIGQKLHSMNLVYVHAEVVTAGTTGTTDIMIYNATDSQDMLSAPIQIDSGETGSDTGSSGIINSAYDDIAENDVIRIDIDSVSTTPAKGLIITLGFSLP